MPDQLQVSPQTNPMSEQMRDRVRKMMERTGGESTAQTEEVVDTVEPTVSNEAEPTLSESTPVETLADAVSTAPGNDSEEVVEDQTEEQIAAEAKKLETERSNKEIEDSRREELLNKSIPDYLTEDTDAAEATTDDATDVSASEREDIARIRAEYEIFESDPLLKAVAEWRKSGGTDISKFVKEAGLTDPSSLDMGDLFRFEGEKYGLTGEELSEYVDEAKEKFDDMSKVDQAKLRDGLQHEFSKVSKEKADKIIGTMSESRKEYEASVKVAQEAAFTEIEVIKNNPEELTEFKGLVIDEKLKQDILNEVPNYSLPVEKDGKIIGYDIKKGIQNVITDKYLNQLLKANYTQGFTKGLDNAYSDRNRVSDNPTAPQNVAATKPDYNKIVRERYNKKFKKHS